MGKLSVWLMTGLVAAVLTGCGQAPATGTATFKAAKPAVAKTAAAKAATKTPTVSSKAGAKAPAAPAAPAAPQAPAAEVAPETGALKVTFAVTGNAPVAKLALKVFEQSDPSVAVDVPVTLTAGAATWAQDEVAPGRYTLQVQALDAANKVLGQGNGEAIVTAGKTAEVALDLRVNTAGTGTSGVTDTDTGTGTTPTPPAQIGGTIGLNIEIY
ncbi:MAG: hypothetical protein ACK46X_15325 [Candidatus Sericytochromatia bacterium]